MQLADFGVEKASLGQSMHALDIIGYSQPSVWSSEAGCMPYSALIPGAAAQDGIHGASTKVEL